MGEYGDKQKFVYLKWASHFWLSIQIPFFFGWVVGPGGRLAQGLGGGPPDPPPPGGVALIFIPAGGGGLPPGPPPPLP